MVIQIKFLTFDTFQILGSLLPSGTFMKKDNENDTEKSLATECSSTPITEISL